MCLSRLEQLKSPYYFKLYFIVVSACDFNNFNLVNSFPELSMLVID